MTFTKQDLLNARKIREDEAENKQRYRELRYQAWKIKEESENLEKVRKAFEDGLSSLLLQSDTNGHASLQLHKGRVFAGSSEIYNPSFVLGFDPDPEYRPTKNLIRMLEDAGFQVSVISQEVENITWVNDCVGFESLGTYHTEHYIVVSW